MTTLTEFLGVLGQWLRPYSSDLALALVASILVIGGNDINRLIKKQFKNAHIILRTLIFVLVCTFGYGALTVVLTRMLQVQLAALTAVNLALVVVAAFVLLGLWAQRKNQI